MRELADLHADKLGGGVVLKQRLVVLVLQKILVRPRLWHKPLCSTSAAAADAANAHRQSFDRISGVDMQVLQASEALAGTSTSHVPERRVRRRCLGRSVREALLARVAGLACIQAPPLRRWCPSRSTHNCAHSCRVSV